MVGGGVVAGGFAGVVAVAAGFVAPGVVPAGRGVVDAAGFAGAGTPDWALYASTTDFVISTDWVATTTGPCGHGDEASIRRP